jgi:L-iditol 2-dehydrogenase
MLAVVKTERKKDTVKVLDVSKPELTDKDVLIRTEACGICGSDLHAYNYDPGYEHINIPVVFGHEYCGTIVDIGSAVEGFGPGDRVVVESGSYCGVCRHCREGNTNICEHYKVFGLARDGGMAQFAAVDARFIHHLDKRVDAVRGALVEPASVAIHAVADKCDIAVGSQVVVTGLGIIGLLAAQVARLKGASRVIMVGTVADEETRLPLARSLGFETISLANQSLSQGVKALTGKTEVDIIIECSGNGKAVEDSVKCLRKGGTLLMIGLYPKSVEIFFTELVRREISIITSYCSKWINYEQAIELLATCQLDVGSLISTYDLKNARVAFDASLNKKVVKAVLLPSY